MKNASAIGSGVDIFPITFTIPFSALATGISVKAVKKYRPQNYIGWAIILIGFGVVSRLDEHSSRAQYICSQLPLGIGLGMVWVGTQFPILAPLPVSNNAHALAFFTFTRRFAQVRYWSPRSRSGADISRAFYQSWGIIIGGTILQNILLKDLPASYVATLPQGVQIAYAVIPDIPKLAPELRADVQVAFAHATQVIWKVMLGISAVGMLTCIPMREEKLRESLDKQWGLKEGNESKADPEKASSDSGAVTGAQAD